jgi:hypothetical protein
MLNLLSPATVAALHQERARLQDALRALDALLGDAPVAARAGAPSRRSKKSTGGGDFSRHAARRSSGDAPGGP